MTRSGEGIHRSRLEGTRTILITSVALALGVAISGVGYASSHDDRAAAKAAFDEGLGQFEASQYKEAATSFRKANALRPNYAIYYNIGQSEAAAKMYGLAFETFERYLAEGGDDIAMDRRTEVLKELEWLEQMVGAVKISAPAEAVVTIDGVERGKAPLPGNLKVAAGVVHRVDVILAEKVIHTESIKVSRKEVFNINVTQASPKSASRQTVSEVGSISPSAESSQQPKTTQKGDARRRKTFKRVGVITLVVGSTLLIGGTITGAAALSINSDLKASCDETVCTSADDKESLKTRDALSPTSTALIGVGAVTAAASLPFWILYARNKNGEQEDGRISIQPTLGQSAIGFDISGRF